jgi:uncharacterized protein
VFTRSTPERGFPQPILANAGIGLRFQHQREVITRRPPAGWFEVHSENYFGDGGAPLDALLTVRQHYPISLHGVGLSIGSTDPADQQHLASLATLIDRVEPVFVSEHLSWSSVEGRFVNDLLPLPYTEESLRHVCNRVADVQSTLGRQILIENPSSYLQFQCSEINEPDFLAALALETGCGLLLDINNVYVSAMNHGFDPLAYLQRIPRRYVRELHVAGHSVIDVGGKKLLVDTHNAPVCAEVWSLYAAAIERFGRVPTLIEWDTDIPALDVLMNEAVKADALLETRRAHAA